MKQIIEQLLQKAVDHLKSAQIIPQDISPSIQVDRVKKDQHGDFASNLAMILAKPARRSPQQIAAAIVDSFSAHPLIERIEIAGPGFINFFIHAEAHFQILARIFDEGDDFGCSQLGKGQKVLLEYVSANPTGPLHVGHGRSAAFGATLANLLKAAGFLVTREYYVNDAGRQMDILAASVWLRYLEIIGKTIVFPANGYRGEYVRDIAQNLRDTLESNQTLSAVPTDYSWETITEGLPPDLGDGGDKEIYIDAIIARAKALLGLSYFQKFHQAALNFVLADIKDDLTGFGVDYDSWFSEKSLLDTNALSEGIHTLKESAYTYEKEGALWFRSTDFGDEKDRVLIRANGQATYFASDIAYHWNKYKRGFNRVINIFGADHHGYMGRIRAAVQALGHDEKALTILLVQFAILYRQGERVQMSTRSGSFVTLRALREEVGNDASRFFYVMRKPEQHMDFDLDLAKSESNENPVYYIQYAHARICSVFRQLEDRGMTWESSHEVITSLQCLNAPEETLLISLLNHYPEVIESAASVCEPHQIAYYLRELANGLHSYYNAVRLLCEDLTLRNARLSLLKAVGQVLKNGLHLLGVSAPEKM
ncbi:MAG: arginine--tRNA ligase [Legionella sp.]|nr:arginine--tRNA ligase [Legionella sp.]